MTGWTLGPRKVRTGSSNALKSCAGRGCWIPSTGRWSGAAAPTLASPTTASPGTQTPPAACWDTTSGPGVWSARRESTRRATTRRGSSPPHLNPSPTGSGFSSTIPRKNCASTASLGTPWFTCTPSSPISPSRCTRDSGCGPAVAPWSCVRWS